MANKKMVEKLKKMQSTWKDAETAEVGKKIKDGEYTAKVKNMEVEFSKAGNRPQVKTIFEVVSPDKYEGEEIWRFDGLTEQGMPYFKALARQLGIELPSKLHTLPDTLADFTDSFEGLVEITVATKDGFTNVYVNDVASDDDGDNDDDDNDDDDDDDNDDDDDDDSDDDGDDDDDDDDDKKKSKKKVNKKVSKKKKKK